MIFTNHGIMNEQQIKELFRKYIDNECNESELHLLENFLKSYQREDISVYFDQDDQAKSKSEMWRTIHSKIAKDKKKRKLTPIFKYAAIFLLLVAGSSLYFLQDEAVDAQVLEIESNPIILRMQNGEEQEFDILGKKDVVDREGRVVANQSGTRLVYGQQKAASLSYNEIVVPYGRKFQVELSDGTIVHLNAGTALRFPVNFVEGRAREVFLTGEAYFEVQEDREHPFLVYSEKLQVEVLGTHFNVNSYRPEQSYVVLSEGSVTVAPKDRPNIVKTIVPGQKATLSKADMAISEVDLSDYLGWIEGQLSFNEEPFSAIIDKIERKYNVTFRNEYEKLNTLKFRGKFDDESIIDLLDVFKMTAGFDYSIQNNTIIIKPPKE